MRIHWETATLAKIDELSKQKDALSQEQVAKDKQRLQTFRDINAGKVDAAGILRFWERERDAHTNAGNPWPSLFSVIDDANIKFAPGQDRLAAAYAARYAAGQFRIRTQRIDEVDEDHENA